MKYCNKRIIHHSERNTFRIYFKICSSIKKTSKRKKVSKKRVTITGMLKDVTIRKEIDEKVDAYEKQLRSKHIKLMN